MIEIQLPKDWTAEKIENVIDFVIGGDWGKDEDFEDYNFGLAYCIRGSEIRNWNTEKGRTASLRKIKISNIEKRKLQEGDILIEISGGGPEQPVGRTVLIDKVVLGYKPEIPKICTNFLRMIRLKSTVYPNYLNYYLQFFYRSGEIVNYQGGSNNLRNLKFPDYLKVKFPLAPKSVQHAIVSKIEELFSELDKSIETLRLAQQQLKTYRQTVLKWAFEGKLTEEWRKENRTPVQIQSSSRENYVVSLGLEPELIAAEPFTDYQVRNNNSRDDKLPEGWNWYNLNQVCKIIGGVTKGRDFKGNRTIQLPYLRVANVQDGYLDLAEVKMIEVLPSDKEKYQLLFGDILYTEGGDKDKLGRGTIWKEEIPNCIHQNHIFRARPNSSKIDSKYIAYYSQTKSAKSYFFKHGKQTTNLASINLRILSNLPLPICDIEEQKKIVERIGSGFSVADKMEESIIQSLQQAEALRQSILKQAFEGKLVVEKKPAVYKPKSEYFYQVNLLGLVIRASKKKDIVHGEMTIAKYSYLLDKVYDVPTYYNYERWHLGPYPPEIKKAINNKKFFKRQNSNIEVADEKTLFKYNNHYQKEIESAVSDLTEIFSKYSAKERAHKTELLATVCKVVEDTQTLDLQIVRTSMKDWKIELETSPFKTKVEKFTESETEKCLAFIIEKGWDKKLISI